MLPKAHNRRVKEATAAVIEEVEEVAVVGEAGRLAEVWITLSSLLPAATLPVEASCQRVRHVDAAVEGVEVAMVTHPQGLRRNPRQ